MRRTLAALLVLASTLAVLPSPAQASHAQGTLPMLAGDTAVDGALAWMAGEVGEEGCVEIQRRGEPVCSPSWTKKFAIGVAQAGADPAAWPPDQPSLVDWMREHTLWDPDARGCECPQQRTLSVTKTILAWTASGQDPSAVPRPDGTTRDLVTDLLDTYDSQQFGSQLTINDDIWAILALDAAGYDGSEVDGAINYVTSSQQADGSLGHSHGATETSVDVTAWAVQAIAPHGRDLFLDRARSYLAQAQTTDGEHRACWPVDPDDRPPAPNAESTAAAIGAIVALGEDPVDWSIGARTPSACLASFQTDAGHFTHPSQESDPRVSAWQALAGFAWTPLGRLDAPASEEEIVQTTREGRETTTSLPDGFLRVQQDARASVTWTPSEPGTRTFHGFRWTPTPHPVAVTVHIDPAPQQGQAPGTAPIAPTVTLDAPETVERNVTATFDLQATPGDAPVDAHRIDWGDGNTTAWNASVDPTHTYRVLGNVTVTAWARDVEGDVSDPVEATVTVADAAPRIQVEGAVHANRSEPVPLTAHARDPDGPTPTIRWQGPGLNATGPTVEARFATPGLHTVQAVATDAAGNTVNASWTVRAVNRAPIDPTVSPLEAPANTTVTLTASAEDPDGDPLTITWSLDDRNATGRELTLETGPPGNRTLAFNVTDPYGGWATATARLRVLADEAPAAASGNVSLTERSEPTGPATRPSKDATPARVEPGTPRVELPDRTRTRAGAATLLQGIANQPHGEVTEVVVEIDGGPPATVDGTGTFTALVPALEPGEHTVRARAAGVDGAWGPWATAVLLVEPQPNDEPLAATGTTASDGSHDAAGATAFAVSLSIAAAALAGRRRHP